MDPMEEASVVTGSDVSLVPRADHLSVQQQHHRHQRLEQMETDDATDQGDASDDGEFSVIAAPAPPAPPCHPRVTCGCAAKAAAVAALSGASILILILIINSAPADLEPAATHPPPTDSPGMTPTPPTPLPDTPSPAHATSARLAGGAHPWEGRVEVLSEGEWGTVCSDGWGAAEASVVCRQLGYPGGATASPRAAYFGRGEGPIHLDGLRCVGWESSLGACSHNPWGQHDCTHAQDAGAVCLPGAPPAAPHPTCDAGCPLTPIQLSTSVISAVSLCGDQLPHHATLIPPTPTAAPGGNSSGDGVGEGEGGGGGGVPISFSLPPVGGVAHILLPEGVPLEGARLTITVGEEGGAEAAVFVVEFGGEGGGGGGDSAANPSYCRMRVPGGVSSAKYVGARLGTAPDLRRSILQSFSQAVASASSSSSTTWALSRPGEDPFPAFSGNFTVIPEQFPVTPPPTPAPTPPPPCESRAGAGGVGSPGVGWGGAAPRHLRGVYLREYAFGDSRAMAEGEALALCESYGWMCRGITCSSRYSCTLRAQGVPIASPTGEYSCAAPDGVGAEGGGSPSASTPTTCTAWRARYCSGSRNPRGDLPCNASIPSAAAGWCQCGGHRLVDFPCPGGSAGDTLSSLRTTCAEVCGLGEVDECRMGAAANSPQTPQEGDAGAAQLHGPCGGELCMDADTSPTRLGTVVCTCRVGGASAANAPPDCAGSLTLAGGGDCPAGTFPIASEEGCASAAGYLNATLGVGSVASGGGAGAGDAAPTHSPSPTCQVRSGVAAWRRMSPADGDEQGGGFSGGSGSPPPPSTPSPPSPPDEEGDDWSTVCHPNAGPGGATPPPGGFAAAAEAQRDAVVGLLRRVLGGAEPAARFAISIVPAEGEAGEEWCSLAAEGGDVRVSGDSGLSASRCIFALLRRHNMSVGWGRGSSGSSVRPASWEDTTIRLNALTRIRYAYNTCTFSYTMAWWGWDRWEREIDWLALRGVNLPLAFVGQEYVWKKLYSGLGLTEEEIWAHFSGGAFLAWQRMGNIEGLGGPLTDSFLAARHSLQVKILRRMSEFGMSPILPAFAGHVPLGLRRVFPNASYTTSERWNGLEETTLLQPDDPLFGEIAQGFIEAQRDAYGKLSHYYNGDTFNEMSPESAESDYLRRSGEAMVEGIKAGDPHGKWVVQGWTFTLEWWRSRPRAVEDYLSGAPNADLLVLDLFSESRPLFPSNGGYFGKPFVWCLLHNFGGRPGVYGNLRSAYHDIITSMAQPVTSLAGLGISMEATGSNPIIYDMVLDMAWQGTGLNDAPLQPLWGKKNPVIPIDSLYAWEGRWVASRYGGGGSGGVEAAWQLLLHTVYEYDIEPDTAKWRIYNRPSMEPGRLSCQCSLFCEEGSPVHRAWSTLLDSPMPGVITWERDLAQFTAYILHTVACGLIVELRGIAQSPFNATSASGTLQQLEALLLDLDAVLATDTNTQLACWVKDAEAWGSTPEEQQRLVSGALAQITVWTTGAPRLNDYAKKGWSGLMRHYYLRRWALLREAVEAAPEGSHWWDVRGPADSAIAAFEDGWHASFNVSGMECAAEGNITQLALALREKYLPSLVG